MEALGAIVQPSRRSFLKTSGVVTAGGVPGCLTRTPPQAEGSNNDRLSPAENHRGYAAFFTLADWTQQVTGDTLEITNPVPVGELGHGWEPTADLQTKITNAAVFVYLDLPEFSWAQDIVSSIEIEETSVIPINAIAGIDLHDYVEQGTAHDHDDQQSNEHDDFSQYDPHVWVDPVIAQLCIDNIATGLREADPAKEQEYADNADQYKQALESLHHRFEATLDSRANEILVFAGHNSYQYLANRYDFEVHSPQGVSPQDEPSTADIIDTIELINDHSIKYIAYDYFQSDSLARHLVAESTAEHIIPMSAAEGTTPEWNDNDWGYLDQMREINLPALEAALGENP